MKTTRIMIHRALGTRSPAGPALALDRDRGTSFTFHGHRLSSLYRADMGPPIPFIFPKILKKLCPWASIALEYLGKDERQGARIDQRIARGREG
jgi:hypothetical protein